MDIFDLLNTTVTSGESTIAVAEDDLGIPMGDGTEATMDVGMDIGGGDPMMDDGFGMEEGGGGEQKITDPLDDVEDAEISLVANLRKNYATLYEESKDMYDRFVSKNYESSEFSAEFKEIKEQFKTELDTLFVYLKNKYDKESTTTRILQFSRSKGRINELIDIMNDLLAKLTQKKVDD